MKKRIIIALLAVLGLALPLSAQTSTTNTSLSAAVGGGTQAKLLTVVSATGITASTSSAQQFIYIEGELMQVTAVSGSTITVNRARQGRAVPHEIGATVWFGAPGTWTIDQGTGQWNTGGVFVGTTPQGRCTRTTQGFLPVINPSNGDISDCILSPAIAATTGALSTTSTWATYNPFRMATAKPYKKIAVTASTYTALPVDHIIGYNTNVAGTITIPAITGWVGKEYWIQLEITGSQSVTIATSSAQTINGGASIVIGGTSFAGVHIYTDGGGRWFAAMKPTP